MKIGTRVKRICDDSCRLSGVVIGHGRTDNYPVVIVRLDEGGYLTNELTHCYISTIAAIPENLEVVESID